MQKIVETRSSLSNTIKYTSTVCLSICREGLHMIVLVYMYWIVFLREVLVSTIFCMVHPYIAIHSVE